MNTISLLPPPPPPPTALNNYPNPCKPMPSPRSTCWNGTNCISFGINTPLPPKGKPALKKPRF
ncbi:MAG: hypothetical protein NTW61_04940 [Candidatus Melainabacteria bacterium]|nr:hypothetical protein [Candidatus Melainabacteria bacterium]